MTYRCTHCQSANIEQIGESKYKCKDCQKEFMLKKHLDKDQDSNVGTRDRTHQDHRSGKM